jgi:hypothetical protein
MVGRSGGEGAADCSVAALTLLGRPLPRRCAMASVGAEGGWGSGFTGAGVASSLAAASGNPPRGAILAVKAFSTRLASSAVTKWLQCLCVE